MGQQFALLGKIMSHPSFFLQISNLCNWGHMVLMCLCLCGAICIHSFKGNMFDVLIQTISAHFCKPADDKSIATILYSRFVYLLSSSTWEQQFILFWIYVFYPDYVGAPDNRLLRDLTEEFWQWKLREYPELATGSGYHQHDDRLESYTYGNLDQRWVCMDTCPITMVTSVVTCFFFCLQFRHDLSSPKFSLESNLHWHQKYKLWRVTIVEKYQRLIR